MGNGRSSDYRSGARETWRAHIRRKLSPADDQGRRGRSLDRDSLPNPSAYLAEYGLLKSAARGEWATICCPVHKGGNETHPSLRVSLVDGHFRCMTCGARGGDLIALHRLVTGLPFRAAVLDLGGRFHD